MIFSATPYEYTEKVVKQIEKIGKCFDYVLSESHLVLTEGVWVKDYSKIGRDMKKVVIIDHIKP